MPWKPARVTEDSLVWGIEDTKLPAYLPASVVFADCVGAVSDAARGLMTRVLPPLIVHFPLQHLVAHEAVAHLGIFVHLQLPPPSPKEVFYCRDISRGDGCGLRFECIPYEEPEFGLCHLGLRVHHPESSERYDQTTTSTPRVYQTHRR